MENESAALLERYLRAWAALHGRKLNDEALGLWVSLFVITPPRVLAIALDKVTRRAERMPTPGGLTKEIAMAYEELGLEQKPAVTFRAGFDAEAGPCFFWTDEPNLPAYRASDCPEGQEYLHTLSNFWQSHKLPTPLREKDAAAKAWNEKEVLRQDLGAAKQGASYTATDADLPDILRGNSK